MAESESQEVVLDCAEVHVDGAAGEGDALAWAGQKLGVVAVVAGDDTVGDCVGDVAGVWGASGKEAEAAGRVRDVVEAAAEFRGDSVGDLV
jgi:hypothetical protein